MLTRGGMRLGDQRVYLTGNYPTIEGFYGGDQEWFRDDVFSNGDLIRLGGCGLIAMADSLLYLASQQELSQPLPSLVDSSKLTMSTYSLFVESLFFRYLQPWRNPLFKPANYQTAGNFVLGIQGWQLRRGFNRFFQHRQSRFYSVKGAGKLSQIIQQQLRRNRPVPLMIGPTSEMFPKGLRFLGRQSEVETHFVPFLSPEFPPRECEGGVTPMSAHWVTVTGYYQLEEREYLLIASWGKRYVLDLTAYLADKDWLSGVVVV